MSSFQIEIEVRPPDDSVPALRTLDARPLARADRESWAAVDARLARWREIFGADGDVVDLGDRFLLLSERTSLEVFAPTESVWWSDRALAFAESPFGEGVLDSNRAADLARSYLERFGTPDWLPAPEWVLRHVTTSSSARSRSPDDTGELVPTMVTATFGLDLGGFPVLGPGGRTRVSFADGDQLAEFAQFWRPVRIVDSVVPIHPMQAIERLASDARFAEAREAGLTVVLEAMQLGHYDGGPAVAQRYLIPVYEMRGRVTGGECEADTFDLFVPAVDIDSPMIKGLTIRNRATRRNVFGSL
jgi:hypothetical protein